MRYIRTKHGEIFDLESKDVSSVEYFDKESALKEYNEDNAFYTIYYYSYDKGQYLEIDMKGGKSCDDVYENDIVKQTNNINDLLDGYIIKFKGTINRVFLKKEGWNFDMAKDYADAFGYEVYGFIETSNGLTYKAKMNEKGDLELI